MPCDAFLYLEANGDCCKCNNNCGKCNCYKRDYFRHLHKRKGIYITTTTSRLHINAHTTHTHIYIVVLHSYWGCDPFIRLCTIGEGSRGAGRAMSPSSWALLEKGGTLTIHKRILQKFMVKIFKKINRLNPPYMRDFFAKKLVEYDFRTKKQSNFASFHQPDHIDLVLFRFNLKDVYSGIASMIKLKLHRVKLSI